MAEVEISKDGDVYQARITLPSGEVVNLETLKISMELSFILMLSFLVLSIITNIMIKPFAKKLPSQITQ